MCLGKIATAHGVKGLVKLLVQADDPHLLERATPLYTGEKSSRTLKLRLKNSMGKYWLAEIEGITDRTQAETLRGISLWIDRDTMPEIEDGAHYVADLIGLRAQDESGAFIGTVIAVDNFGASDLLDIKPEQGESFYLHFTDETVLDIDLEAGTITVFIPEGLLP